MEQQVDRVEQATTVGNPLLDALQPNDWKSAAAPTGHEEIVLHEGMAKGNADTNLPSVVIVDKNHHLTHVLQMQDGKVRDVLTVPDTVGKSRTPTPEGRLTVINKRLDPVWTPPKSIDPQQRPIAPYKYNHHNPIGVAFIRLSADDGRIGLHGTNRPDQIGKSASHGCIRHTNDDILKIYTLVHSGTPVYIVKKFDGTAIQPEDFNRHF